MNVDQPRRDGTGNVRHRDEARAARTTLDYYGRQPGGNTWAQILLDKVYNALQHKDPALLRAGLADIDAVASDWIDALDGELE